MKTPLLAEVPCENLIEFVRPHWRPKNFTLSCTVCFLCKNNSVRKGLSSKIVKHFTLFCVMRQTPGVKTDNL